MGKRITSLQEITTVTDNDFIPVDNQSSGVRKISAGFLNDIEDALDGKQDALTPGANINIAQDGTISATDTTYTAGTNVDITNGVISATDTDTLSELTDTAISSPSDGDALVYDSTSGKWVNGGVASDIGDLNDVDITSPTNGQVLTYDSVNQEWVNSTPSTGSSNLYGYTVPSSSQGVDGDLYGKIKDITGEDVIEISSTITVNNGNPATINLPRDSSLYDTFTITGDEIYNGSTYSVNQTLNASSIGTSAATATRLGTRTGFSVYKSGASLVFICNSWTGKLSGLSGVYTTDHAVTDIYQNINGSWAKYEDKEGSDVSVTQVQSSGTKIATVTVDNVDTDLYAPTGGSANSYGYTTPSSSSGSDGDIYNKIEDITGTDETVTTPVSVTTNTTFQFPKSISEYSTITVTGSNGGTDFEPQTVAVENIGTDMSHQTYIGTSGIMWYKTTDSVVMWATNAEITSCYGTYTNSHKIVDIYQKTSNSWSKYEDKGSIVVANPSSTGSTDLTKIGIDGTVYNIPTGGSGSSTLAGLTDVDLDTPTDGQGLVYDATNQKWVNDDVGSGSLTAVEMDYEDWLALPQSEREDPTIEYFLSNAPGGGGGSGYEETVLWSGEATISANASPFTIPNVDSDTLDAYDELIFETMSGNEATVIQTRLTTSFIKTHPDIMLYGHGRDAIEVMRCVNYQYISSSDELNVYCETNKPIIFLQLKGVNYGSGSGGGGNLYGTTNPTSDLGSNGDIYMKYQGGSEPIEGETETLTNVHLEITKGNDWVALPNFDTSLYYSVIFNYSANQELSTKINISDISTDANNPTIFGNTYDDLYGYINNSTLYLKTVTWNNTINSAIVTLNVFQPPQILNVYGKVEDEWVGFPEEGYEETTLWEGSQSITQYSVPFTIPDIGIAELNKYDAFAFDFYNSYSIPRLGIMLTSHIKNHKDVDVTLAPDPVDGAKPLLIHYDSANDVLKAFATTNYGYTLTKVIGIKYGNGGGSGSSSLNYSTDEQVVGTWIDGKPIYQKTYSVTSPSDGNFARVVDCSDLNIDTMVDITGFIKTSANITKVSNSSFILWYRTKDNGATPNDCIMCQVNNSSYYTSDLYITSQYTKTTDV